MIYKAKTLIAIIKTATLTIIIETITVGSPTQQRQPAPSVTSEAWHSASQLCWV
jgi:hypothetical protein